MVFHTDDPIGDHITYVDDLKTSFSAFGLILDEDTQDYIVSIDTGNNGTNVSIRSTAEFTAQNETDIRSHFSTYTEIG